MKLVLLAIILQLVSLTFFILASISAPTLTSIFLAKDNDNSIIYGIFGYCSLDVDSKYDCTTISLFTKFSETISDSIIKSTMLDKISPSLIVAPISAGLTFLSLILNIISIFSSLKFLWVSSIFVAVLSFLSSAYTCIIVFLIFYHSVSWLSWCLIPSAAINFANLIIVAIAFKLLPSPDDIFHEDEEDEKEKIDSINNGYLDTHPIYYNQNLINNNTNHNNTFDDVPQLNNVTIDKSNFIIRNNSTISSFSIKENDKNDFLVVSERLNTENSNSSNQSLKIPNVENPYDKNTDNLNYASSTADFDDDFGDNRLSPDGENISTSADSLSSNFTSISQRPINPNYYAGALNGPPIPLNNNKNYNNINNSSINPNPNPTTNGQTFQHQQQHYQQRQCNQYQNQMSSMPGQQRTVYMNKPKPYMMMGQRSTGDGSMGMNMNMNMNMNMRNQTYNGHQMNMRNKQSYSNQPFHPLNPYAPNPLNVSNQRPSQTNFIPMKYRARNNMKTLPASSFGNDGPYSGFR